MKPKATVAIPNYIYYICIIVGFIGMYTMRAAGLSALLFMYGSAALSWRGWKYLLDHNKKR